MQYFSMGIEEELEKEIRELEAQLREREDSLPAHSVRPQQILVIEELEEAIEGKKKELQDLRRNGCCPLRPQYSKFWRIGDGDDCNKWG